MKLTDREIDIITEFLRIGEPLPKEFKERLLFQGDENVIDDNVAHIKRPLFHEHLKELIGAELKRQGLFDKIQQIASSDVAVLIEGERGTGKKLIAKTIHEVGSRVNGPFIMVDCSSISEVLSEGLLVGHERGAFEGAIREKKGRIEIANHGTIVFDEAEKLPSKSQAVLLRFLRDKVTERLGSNQQISIDARVIAATSHQDLKAAVLEGTFRNDLYYYISSITLSVPPLRERRADIPALSDFFLLKYSKLYRKKIRGVSPQALEALWHYNWPGNVSELENRIKGAVVTAKGIELTPEDLAIETPKDKKEMRLKDARENLERNLILRALAKHRNSITEACEELGISRPTIYDRMKKLQIKWKEIGQTGPA
jgi:two-component system NtrC family response regulator